MTKCKFSELKPGDWFEFCGFRYICVMSGGHPIGRFYGWNPAHETRYFCSRELITPLPDCTGWDWEPEPEVRYRNEYADNDGVGQFLPGLDDIVRWRLRRRDFIGYTIRRVWPDGRVEQEFVPKEDEANF